MTETLATNNLTNDPQAPLAITHDLTTVKSILDAMVQALQAPEAPRSHERSLCITKLQEARMWALEAQAQE